MTVELVESAPKDARCAICGHNYLIAPYMHWAPVPAAAPRIYICGSCCAAIKSGFIADLVHVAAIMEFRKYGGHAVTLARTTRAHLREQDKAAELDILKWQYGDPPADIT